MKEEEKVKVSVIIPLYNNEKYLEECVRSIQNQTYQNFEIIICDDCSVDGSYQKAKELAKNDQRIKVLRNEKNSKAAYTRNHCIQEAEGELIAIQDADDYSLTNRLEKEVQFLDKNLEYAYVASSANIVNSEEMKKSNISNEGLIKDKDFLINLPFAHTSVMIRKKIIEQFGGYRVAKDTIRGQDYDLFLRLQVNKVKGYKFAEPLVCYREETDAFKRRTYRSRIDGYHMRKKYFKDLNIKWYEKIYQYRPLLVGLVPIRLQKLLRKIRR